MFFYDGWPWEGLPNSLSCTCNPDNSIIENSANDIILFPNPTSGELRITNEQSTIKNVEIFDIYGKKLLLQTTFRALETAIDISHLSTGIYFVKIYTESGEVTRKVVKE